MSAPLVIAHRGDNDYLPEHTLAAYQSAIEAGADGLECDVRMTLDGHLVCVHDSRVERTSNGTGSVSRQTLGDLRALDWGSWKHPDLPSSARSLLTLRELFELVHDAPRPVQISVETKHPCRHGGAVERELAALVTEFGWAASERVRMMSFSITAVRRMRRLVPELPLVLLMDRLLPQYASGGLPPGVGTTGISTALLRRAPEYVRRAHEAGHAVHVWTVDTAQDVEACLDAGVDAIITNRPREILRRVHADDLGLASDK